MALSSNGSTWDIGMATGTVDLSPRTTYYVEYGFTGTEYTTAISLNKESYIPDMILPSDKKLHITTTYIGGSPDLFGVGTAHPFEGSINFNDSEVEVQTDLGWLVVWEGMADVGFATRANVSLSNLDEAGEARFDAKANVTDLTAHASNETIHVTASDKIAWSQKVNQDQLLGYGSELDYADDTLSLLNTAGETLSRVNIKSTPDLDNSTISLNASDELQAIGVIEKNKGLAKYDWVGTLEEYETQQVETLHPDWICYITDDVSGGASVYTKNQVNNLLSAKANSTDVYTKSETNTALNAKVNNSDLVQCEVIVETWHEGTEWYRVWSDGWCEQGGAWGTNTSNWANASVVFHKSFVDTNYNLLVQGNWNEAGSSSCKVTARSNTGFTGTYANNLYSVMPSYWEAKGYIR